MQYSDLCKGEAIANAHLLGAGRALGCLEAVFPAGHSDEAGMGSVAILVALVVQKQDTALLELPLLHPKYHWSEDLASGLANYANYWIKTLREQSSQRGRA